MKNRYDILFCRYLQAARVGSHATSEPTGAVSQRKYHGSTVVVKEFDTPSPTKTVVKTKTRKDFAKTDEEMIPLCSPAHTPAPSKHIKQH